MKKDVIFQGTPICRGIAIGRPFFLEKIEEIIPEMTISADRVPLELSRYQKAISNAHNDIQALQKRLQSENLPDGVAILDAHLQMIQDPLFTENVEEQIRKKGKNAEHIFQAVVAEYQAKFSAVASPFFRERLCDIQDISRRVLEHLRGNARVRLADIASDTIVFANNLAAFDIAEANGSCVGAFVTNEGGATSHAAILAKGRGIPYVSSVDLDAAEALKSTWVIVDGRTGELILHPSEETLQRYYQMRSELSAHTMKLQEMGALEAETYDGYGIELSANVEMLNEIDIVHQFGGNGVGLLRTESVFLFNNSFPNEEEQFTVYKQFAEKMKGLPIVIRTFDFGGDKQISQQQQTQQECNPFLGCRAIRFLLREQELFKTQLRAILRASAYGDVRIMFPMISGIGELFEAKAVLAQARQEVLSQGKAMAPYIPIGCMIEVPSAAIIADLLAKECDFLSIGTNDLVQYALAVDRSNSALTNLYAPTHPSIIRLLRLVVSEANHHGVSVSVCGEVAADPRFTALLLGLGVHELSVAPRYLPTVKNAIRNTSIVAASKLAERALTLSSAAEIEELITRNYRANVPEDCFYNY